MITKAYSQFFKELEINNTRDWFHTNKKRYENDVKLPFLNLLSALIPTLHRWDNRILLDERKAMFRINRDLRFSKDKTPYNVLLKAGFSPDGRKSFLPGYYLGISSDTIHVGGGLFNIKSEELKKLRQYISHNTNDFLAIVNHKNFENKFESLQGERSKRIDQSLTSTAEKTMFIYNKQFYAMARLPLTDYYGNSTLKETIISHFRNIKPLNKFLESGMLS